MKILAIDSSGAIASVSVLENENVLGQYTINNKLTHSQKLMPIIQQLLESIDIKPSDIDVFACAVGPGSFTGLRIGISIVKGMAQALNKPVIGISTLDGLAWNIPGFSGYICPIMDARNDNVYTAIYSSNSDSIGIEPISEYMAVHINELIDKLPKDKPICFVGDGILKFKNILSEGIGNICYFPPEYVIMQNSVSIGHLAYKKAISGDFDSTFNIVPLYLRSSQAERANSAN